MEDLLIQKFKIPELVKALLDTGTAELIEGNWWGDKFWGVCRGQGKNHLGKLLMKIRVALTARAALAFSLGGVILIPEGTAMAERFEDFEILMTAAKSAGFIGWCRPCRAGQGLYAVLGTNCIEGEIKALQNAVMITINDGVWTVQTTWPGQIGQTFIVDNTQSMIDMVISLLNSKKEDEI